MVWLRMLGTKEVASLKYLEIKFCFVFLFSLGWTRKGNGDKKAEMFQITQELD